MQNQEFSGLITKIEQQKRNKKRYNIYIENEYAFSVHEDILVSLRLLKGKYIKSQEVKEIMQEEEKKKIERAIFHYLSYRPRTVMEVKRYLLEKGYKDEFIQYKIDEFIQKGYLNDKDFAQQWVTERIQTKKKGFRLLAEELKQKGISPSILEQIMSNMDQEEEWQSCYQLALKKIKNDPNLEDVNVKHKLMQYLARRGFSFDLIQRIYTKIMEERGDV